MLKKRIQGSITVAMLVAASLYAPVVMARPMTEMHPVLEETLSYFEMAWDFLTHVFVINESRGTVDGNGFADDEGEITDKESENGRFIVYGSDEGRHGVGGNG